MFEIHPSDWPMAADATDPRNQFHATAMHEARVASDFRGFAPAAPARESIVARLRLALVGGPSSSIVEPCNCPA